MSDQFAPNFSPVQVIEPEEVFEKTGLAYLHTSHCLANGDIMISAMGDPEGKAQGEANHVYTFLVLVRKSLGPYT